MRGSLGADSSFLVGEVIHQKNCPWWIASEEGAARHKIFERSILLLRATPLSIIAAIDSVEAEIFLVIFQSL